MRDMGRETWDARHGTRDMGRETGDARHETRREGWVKQKTARQ